MFGFMLMFFGLLSFMMLRFSVLNNYLLLLMKSSESLMRFVIFMMYLLLFKFFFFVMLSESYFVCIFVLVYGCTVVVKLSEFMFSMVLAVVDIVF